MPGAVPAEDLPANIVPASDMPAGLTKTTAPDPRKRFNEKGEEVANQGPHWLRSAILPTLGGVGGGAAGSFLGPFGTMGGEMAGSALGAKTNQWLGIDAPSNTDVVLQGLSPLAGRVAAPLLKGAANTIVKTFAGRDIMSEAASSLLTKWMSPKVSSKALFEEAGQLEMSVPADKTINAIDATLKTEVERAPTEIKKQIIDAVKPLRNYFLKAEPIAERAPKAPLGNAIKMGESNFAMPGWKPDVAAPAAEAATAAAEPVKRSLTGKLMSAPEMMEESQRLRAIASKAYEDGNSKLGLAIDNIRSAMLDDLEASGAGVVKEAAGAYRKEMALESLGKLLGKPHPVQKIADYMKDNTLFKGAFSEPEKAQITRIAKKLAHVPASGGSGVVGKIATTAIGEHLAGGAGAVAGYFTPEVIRTLLSSPFARNYTERILSSSLTLDQPTAAALAMFAKGMMSHAPKKNEGQNPDTN